MNIKYMEFGTYPQTLKEESVIITETVNEKGYYLGSDGCYYARLTAAPHENDFKFSNGEIIIPGETYYFKVEPILWRRLKNKKGRTLLWCNSIIESRRFAAELTDYAQSEIRAWLNDTFLKTAFTEKQQKRIMTALVDNSVESAGIRADKEFDCAPTEDKIFLLSYDNVTSDICTAACSACKSRERVASDYSRAMGAYFLTGVEMYGNGYWWLRSHGGTRGWGRVRVVFGDGSCDYCYYYSDSEFGGVVPALWLML